MTTATAELIKAANDYGAKLDFAIRWGNSDAIFLQVPTVSKLLHELAAALGRTSPGDVGEGWTAELIERHIESLRPFGKNPGVIEAINFLHRLPAPSPIPSSSQIGVTPFARFSLFDDGLGLDPNGPYVLYTDLQNAISLSVTDEHVDAAREAHQAVFQEIIRRPTAEALDPANQEANDRRMMRAALEAALVLPAAGGRDAWSDDLATAPAACHVLAAWFEHELGEWVTDVVMSPPAAPYTHWRALPTLPAPPAPQAQT